MFNLQNKTATARLVQKLGTIYDCKLSDSAFIYIQTTSTPTSLQTAKVFSEYMAIVKCCLYRFCDFPKYFVGRFILSLRVQKTTAILIWQLRSLVERENSFDKSH